MIAGASIFMLSPAFLTALPGASAASNSNRQVRADAVSTRKKTGKPARRVRSSPELNVAGSDIPGLAKAPLHGYGTFEGVVLVPPAQRGKGIVLVEPAAATAATEAEPTSESSDDIPIPKDLSEQQEDPFESFNRGMFAFNEVLDHLILEPSARIYHAVVPQPLREGVANAVRNLGSPVILANDILQGNRKRASDTVVRFMVNSTIGLGGFVDAAGYMGVPYHQEDFGQTLAVWGVGPGPYMVVPILGPSNPRDLTGKVVDTAINPLTWILIDKPLEQRMAPGAAQLVVGREAILDEYANLRKTSPDLYASVRDIYGQIRQTAISNGDVTGEPIPGVTSLPADSVMTNVKPF
jgi:phospholipid-binding lipoprotein MlaA